MDQLFIKVTINLYPEIVYVNIYDIGISNQNSCPIHL